jgi:hypothetical protein
MVAVTERECQLMKKLAAEGKATRLLEEEFRLAKTLKADGFVFLVCAPETVWSGAP